MEKHTGESFMVSSKIGAPVRVSIPASVAYDMDKFSKVHRGILERLGCGACTSGHDIRFEVIRNFTIDEKLNIIEAIPGLR